MINMLHCLCTRINCADWSRAKATYLYPNQANLFQSLIQLLVQTLILKEIIERYGHDKNLQFNCILMNTMPTRSPSVMRIRGNLFGHFQSCTRYGQIDIKMPWTSPQSLYMQLHTLPIIKLLELTTSQSSHGWWQKFATIPLLQSSNVIMMCALMS